MRGLRDLPFYSRDRGIDLIARRKNIDDPAAVIGKIRGLSFLIGRTDDHDVRVVVEGSLQDIFVVYIKSSVSGSKNRNDPELPRFPDKLIHRFPVNGIVPGIIDYSDVYAGFFRRYDILISPDKFDYRIFAFIVHAFDGHDLRASGQSADAASVPLSGYDAGNMGAVVIIIHGIRRIIRPAVRVTGTDVDAVSSAAHRGELRVFQAFVPHHIFQIRMSIIHAAVNDRDHNV